MNSHSGKREPEPQISSNSDSASPQRERWQFDYMVRDYQSFRQLMLDRISQTTNLCVGANEADIGLVLVELLAYVGDQLSYYQDAVATEAYLGTARKRVSVKRHARLIGYEMHEGHNARTWVCFDVKGPTTLPKGTRLITYRDHATPCVTLDEYERQRGTEFVFETQFTKRMYANLNRIGFHTCEKTVNCIPKGSTSAVLQNQNSALFETLWCEGDLESQKDRIIEVFREEFGQKWVDENSTIELANNRIMIRNQKGSHHAEFVLANDKMTPLITDGKILRNLYVQNDCRGKKRICFLTLDPGDVIIFEEVSNSKTYYAEASRKWAVRLSEVKPAICEQTDEPIVEIRWMTKDATPFPFTVDNSTPPGSCTSTIARGNLVLADHGDTRIETVTKFGNQTQLRFLPGGPITYSARNGSLGPASKIGQTSFRDSLPNICLFELNRAEHKKRKKKWSPKRDLLSYNKSPNSFQLELDDDGTGVLFFGPYSRGTGTMAFEVTYRIGNGSVGNIGANAINGIVEGPFNTFSQITKVCNPLPAVGGIDPEQAETVRFLAPIAFVNAREKIKYSEKPCSSRVIRNKGEESKGSKAFGGEKNCRNQTRVYNPPGLSSLAYRIGTYGSFKQEMLDDLGECANLQRINSSKKDDFVPALIDALACVCDGLTFYQERIANEGYLRTATERKSIMELCRSVGRALSTGVAADTFLAFEIEENVDTKKKLIIPIGTKVQNIPLQSEVPKIFETIEEIEVSPHWNRIRPHRIARYPGNSKKEDCIKIDAKIEGLHEGRYIALSGKTDEPGQEIKSEVVQIKKIGKNEKLTLVLNEKLNTRYKIETVEINANVAKATHGESKSEILGDGDPTLFQQEFMLRHRPLTYVNAPGNGQRTHTLRLLVDGIEWKSVPNFYGVDSNERCYVVQHDENGNTMVIFGDGERGARPSRGNDNICAYYRVGIGTEGMVNAGQLKTLLDKQYGVRSVTNPLATANAIDPESASEARTKILPILLSMTRPVSRRDLKNIAQEYDQPLNVERTNKSCALHGLYRLLPTIYKQRDAESGHTLRELFGVMERQLDIIEKDIEQLYDNWFIETCEPWVIPYIADLIGAKPPYPNEDEYERNRAFVGNFAKCFLRQEQCRRRKPKQTSIRF